jgi:pyrimidine operon attenuation protein/uracil phosphoribosyltransferase
VKRQEDSAGGISRFSDLIQEKKKQKDKEDLREDMIMLGIAALGSVLAEKMERKLKRFMSETDMDEVKGEFKRIVELEDDE